MGMHGMTQMRVGFNRGMMGGHMVMPRGNGMSHMGQAGNMMAPRMGGGMAGMNKFGMNQRMMQMQAQNPFARMPGMYPLKPVPKGVDGGHIGSLHPAQLHGIYGSLGNAPKPPVRKPGEALKVQLIDGGAGGAMNVNVKGTGLG